MFVFGFSNTVAHLVKTRGGHDEAEPIITYRGHTNVVTCVAILAEQNRVYSAGLDASIRVWRLPGEGHELFSPVGKYF